MYIWIIFNLPQVLQGIYFLLIHDIYISGFPRIGQRKCLCLSFLALQELNPHAQGVTLQELNPHAQGVTLAAVFNCIIVRQSAVVNLPHFNLFLRKHCSLWFCVIDTVLRYQKKWHALNMGLVFLNEYTNERVWGTCAKVSRAWVWIRKNKPHLFNCRQLLLFSKYCI